MSGDWCAAGVAIDHLPAGEFAEQDRRGAHRRGYGRSVLRDGEAGPDRDLRHRRHVLCGTWRPAACILERASRRARLCVDAHLSRRERRAGRHHPARGAHPEGHGGEDGHEARDEGSEAAWAGDQDRVAGRQSLRPHRGDGMDRRERWRLHFWPSRQLHARCAGGKDRRQSALPSCQKPSGEGAHPYELHLSGGQLDTSAQGGSAAGVFLAAGRGRNPSTGMRQEVDIRYVVTSLKGSAEYLYEDVYCGRGQMENVIKLHKAQLASDRMSCHSATANQVRLALHTAAYWLMLGVRDAIPQTEPLAKAEFATIRERLIKIGARVIEHLARIRIQLPTSCPEGRLFRALALRLAPSSA